MDRYAAGKIEGLLRASRKFLEFAAEELRVATSGARQIELGIKLGHAISDLTDVSREIYVDHPKLNPFLEMEKATAEWQAKQGHKPRTSKKARSRVRKNVPLAPVTHRGRPSAPKR